MLNINRAQEYAQTTHIYIPTFCKSIHARHFQMQQEGQHQQGLKTNTNMLPKAQQTGRINIRQQTFTSLVFAQNAYTHQSSPIQSKHHSTSVYYLTAK